MSELEAGLQDYFRSTTKTGSSRKTELFATSLAFDEFAVFVEHRHGFTFVELGFD